MIINTLNAKKQQISLFVTKDTLPKIDLFIQFYKNYHKYFNNYKWVIYGVRKNIQTIEIDDLFINLKTKEKSQITNFIENETEEVFDKINVYSNNDDMNKNIEKSMFVCFFENVTKINNNFINIVKYNSIPILYKKLSNNIYINSKQTLSHVKCGIYIDNLESNNIVIEMNKYIKSKNSYLSLLKRCYSILRQVIK